MRLKEAEKLRELWDYAMCQKADIILMRHAPKAGSNESRLSRDGERLAAEYGKILETAACARQIKNAALYRTRRNRTSQTLKLIFQRDAQTFILCPALDVNTITQDVEDQVKALHARLGHWRGYALNQTYYFLEALGGVDGPELLHTDTAERMKNGIFLISEKNGLRIYCGHSPQIEVAAECALGMRIIEFGGFLKPLDSLHLRKEARGGFTLVARINPIVDYVDSEAEAYVHG